MAPNSNFTFTPGHLNFTHGNNAQGILEFDMTTTNISIIGPEIDSLFDPQMFSYPQPCAYAISGQYGFLPRLLYYLLLVISLLLRKHDWLSAGALTGAMTYSASACVHAFALLLRYEYNTQLISDDTLRFSRPPRYFGDADLVGIFPLLVAGCIMLTPILNWSTMIRKHHAQAVVLYWGFLMFFALIFTLPPIIRGVQPYIVEKLATCYRDPSIGCTYENVMSGDGSLVISLDFYKTCRCYDTCGAILLSDAPFRQNTSLQAYLIKPKVFQLLLKSSFTGLRIFSLVFLLFIIWQGILGMIAIQWGQRGARNWIFRRLGGTTPYSGRDSFISKTRYYVGKTIAGAFYLFAIFVTGFSPFLFVCSIIVNEIVVWAYPVAETYDAIGQWSIWVIAGFIASAAIIQRYNSAWVKSAKLLYSTTIHLIKELFGKGTSRTPPLSENQIQPKNALGSISAFLTQCRRPFQHIAASVAGFWGRVFDEWQDFKRWRTDPVAVSNEQNLDRSRNDDLQDGLLRHETEMTLFERESKDSMRKAYLSQWNSYTSMNDPRSERTIMT